MDCRAHSHEPRCTVPPDSSLIILQSHLWLTTIPECTYVFKRHPPVYLKLTLQSAEWGTAQKIWCHSTGLMAILGGCSGHIWPSYIFEFLDNIRRQLSADHYASRGRCVRTLIYAHMQVKPYHTQANGALTLENEPEFRAWLCLGTVQIILCECTRYCEKLLRLRMNGKMETCPSQNIQLHSKCTTVNATSPTLKHFQTNFSGYNKKINDL